MSSILSPNPLVPNMPQPLANVGALTVIAQLLQQGVQSLAGQRGNVLDRAVTLRDLVALGLVTETQIASTQRLPS